MASIEGVTTESIQPARSAPACSLSREAAARQLAQFRALCERALTGVERDATSVTFSFDGGADVRAALEDYVAVERECCAFLEFELGGSGARTLLRIAAGEGTPASVLHEMYGSPAGAHGGA